MTDVEIALLIMFAIGSLYWLILKLKLDEITAKLDKLLEENKDE